MNERTVQSASPQEKASVDTALPLVRRPHSARERRARPRDRNNTPVELGMDAPLDHGGGEPSADRRAVSLRWLGASLLTAIIGTVLIGTAIRFSLENETAIVDQPQVAQAPARSAEQGSASARKGDRLVRTEATIGARHTFRAPMTLRSLDREVIKVRPFVRISTSLATSTGVYATDIPPFNPLRLFAEAGTPQERYVDAAPEVSDADVSVVKLDLATFVFGADAAGLNDAEVQAQLEEERRLAPAPGRGPSLPIPPQLMLSRTLLQPAPGVGEQARDLSPIDTPFSAIEVRVVPENVTILPKNPATLQAGLPEEQQIQLKKGETLDQALKTNGASPEQIRSIVAALGGRARVNAIPEGQFVRITVAEPPYPTEKPEERQVVRVSLVGETAISAIAAVNDRGTFVSVAPPVVETASASSDDDSEEDAASRGNARLYESLYETAMKHELPRSTIDELVRVFSYDVDFQRRVSPSDSLEVFLADDDETGDRGEVLFASLNVGGESRRVFRFVTPEDGLVDYFDDEGKSLKKFLLRKPITDGELRSGFGYRRHPILGYSKMHTGVDWSNRIGTPILASGNGTIIKAEWDGGYGRRVEVQHANGYVTTYSHMSGFARGIQPGTKVRQGQVIGYLGNTGLSTGPHLHYEVMVNGHFVNPMRIRVPRGRELDGRLLAEFRRQRDQVLSLMERSNLPRFAQTDLR